MKTAIITGCSRGIGLATVDLLTDNDNIKVTTSTLTSPICSLRHLMSSPAQFIGIIFFALLFFNLDSKSLKLFSSGSTAKTFSISLILNMLHLERRY